MSKRKAYRPKPVMLNPLASIYPLPADRRTATMLKFHTALAVVERGEHPGVEEWRDLADLVNLLETMVFMHKLDRREVLPDVIVANDEARAAAVRYGQGKGMRMSGSGLVAWRNCLSMWEQVLEQFSERDIDRVRAECVRAIQFVRATRPDTIIQL